MPSISISNSNVLPENLWISAEFLLFSTGPLSYIIFAGEPFEHFSKVNLLYIRN